MTGTIYRLPDDRQLQRGITYTILPDGRPLRVPAMSRLQVRAESESHDDQHGKGMLQALQDILKGRKPVAGRVGHNRRGRVHQFGAAFDLGGRNDPYLVDPHEGLRPAGGLGAIGGGLAGDINAEM